MGAEQKPNFYRLIQVNKEKAIIQPTVYPFALRGFPVSEITLITGFTVYQVESAIRIFREKGEENGGLRRPLKEETAALIIRANTGRKKGEPPEYTSDQLKGFVFAKKLQEAGMVTIDLFNWNELNSLYNARERELPYTFAESLRLEVFLAARIALQQGDPDPIRKYRDIGDEVDAEWFERSLQGEEDFIANIPLPNVFGFGEDAEGFFTQDQYGKWRSVVIEENVIFDNSWLAAQRLASRNRLAKIGK